MANFPTTFSELHINLGETDISRRGSDALLRLSKVGLEVVSGIQEADMPEILAIGSSEDVREYCPNDVERFSNPEKWLKKGRGGFLLRSIDTEEIVGYSWVGTEETHELPEHPTTTAFRTTVKGTGADLVIATLEGARAVHGAKDFGLETWARNTAAVKTYIKTGAKLINLKNEEPNKKTGVMERVNRATLRPNPSRDFTIDGEWRTHDTRLYMGFPEPYQDWR